MTIVLVVLCIWGCSALIRAYSAKQSEREFQRIDSEIRQRKAEQKQMAQELAQQKRDAELYVRKQIALEREQMKLAKEQAKQAEVLRKHEERLMKLEQRMATAESEIAFNREQRERLFSLLDIEELERDASIPGGKEWQKHQKKVISLENQIHTIQKRIDKAQMDKAFCEKQMSA